FDVIRPRLYTADGKELRMDSGRDGKPRATPPAMLAPGASWTWRSQAKLSWTKDRGTLMLDGPDGRGIAGFWSFTALKQEKYRLTSEYASNNPKQDDIALWVGQATTNEVEFEIAPRKEESTDKGHAREVYSVALSADGKQVVTGSADTTAILWEAATGKKLQTFQGHTQSVVSVALSTDGKHMLTGSYDKTAILWE